MSERSSPIEKLHKGPRNAHLAGRVRRERVNSTSPMNRQMLLCYDRKLRMWLFLLVGMFVFLQLRQLERLNHSFSDDDKETHQLPTENKIDIASELTVSNHSLVLASASVNTSSGNTSSPQKMPPTLLDSYSYSNHPIVDSSVYKPSSSTPLPVVLVGTDTSLDMYHGWILDGVDRSKYLYHSSSFIYNVSHRKTQFLSIGEAQKKLPLVYIVDWANLQRDCFLLEKLLLSDNGVQPKDGAYLLYIDMTATTKVTTCPKVDNLFDKARVRVAKRSIVDGRTWNSPRSWVVPGSIMENEGHTNTGGNILHTPQILREGFVQEVASALGENPTVKNVVYKKSRSTDVAHFWRKGDYSHYGFLRREVSSILTHKSSRTLNRIQGDEDAIENSIAQPEYVQALLKTKIAVVAQNDEWEDHYRLFESMAAGALVFTDTMLAAPHGLRNRTNVVVYDNRESLKRQIKYYLDPKHKEERLAIARHGWKYAMGKHRSWHRLEGLIFGQAKTLVNKPEDPPPARN